MKHRRDNNTGSVARVRVSIDMLPKGIQRAHRDKQLDVMKKIFKRTCEKYGIPRMMKEHEYYVKPGEKKRKAKRLKKAVARGEIKGHEDYDREIRYFDEYNY